MSTHRERVLQALNHQTPDRLPKDLGQEGGYIFCIIHHILREIAPEKIIAMYHIASTNV